MKNKNNREERKKRRNDGNKTDILEAAEKIFSHWGYSLTTMDAIAKEAQFSKATLYRYFPGKKEIFLSIFMKSIEDIYIAVKNISESQKDASEKLKEYIHFSLAFFKKKEHFIHIFMLEKHTMRKIFGIDFNEFPVQKIEHPKIPPFLLSKMKEISNLLQNIIKVGIESESFKEIDPKKAVYALRSLIKGFLMKGPLDSQEYSLNESTEIIINIFLNGIKKHSPSGKGV